MDPECSRLGNQVDVVPANQHRRRMWSGELVQMCSLYNTQGCQSLTKGTVWDLAACLGENEYTLTWVIQDMLKCHPIPCDTQVSNAQLTVSRGLRMLSFGTEGHTGSTL